MIVTINDQNWQEHHRPAINGVQVRGGCEARDYKSHPLGCYNNIQAFDLPLIPENEWEERLAEQKAKNKRYSIVRGQGMFGKKIPSRDQNGKGYCATADTEVLTEHGWVAYPDYDWQSPIATVNPLTHAMEFQQPFERHVYEYDGPMIYSTNRRLDFGVTPDHQMYVRKWNERRRTLSNEYSFVRASDLGWYAGMLAAPSGQIGTEIVEVEIPGDRRYNGDDFMALISLIVSDGYAGGSESTRNWVSFASFHDRVRPAVEALARRVGFKEKPSQRGVWCRYDAGALASWLRENCYAGVTQNAHSKKVPDIVKCGSQRQIKHFLNWYGDRSFSGQPAFWTVSKKLVDDLQELHLRIGRRSTIRSRPPKETSLEGKPINGGSSYVLTVSETDSLCIDRKKHIESDRYQGLVYCAGVPNHTLLTRRNGSVLISSNCWAHSSVSALLLMRALLNLPYVDLSAYAVACIIKNYRDQGGWCAQSVDWMAENGCPDSKYWPQQSMSKSNDTPEMRANAKLHRYLKWVELEPKNQQQLITLLLQPIPVPVISDFNWWSHSVCTMQLESIKPLRTRIWNSWGDSWSEEGEGLLEERKCIPDGAIAPLLTTLT